MTVRLAIAGAGLIGLRHAQAMAQTRGVRLAALIDPAPSDAARALAAAAGVPLLPDLDALPAKAADGVILATPNAAHAAGALACIARGCPCGWKSRSRRPSPKRGRWSTQRRR